MIYIGMDPNLVTIGPFTLTWHGFLTAVAVIVGVMIAARLARSFGLTEDGIFAVALWAVPGGIIGARAVHVIDNWDAYVQNPMAIFNFQGTAIYGAIIGGAAAGVGYAYLRKMNVGRVADVAAFGLIVAMIVGRIGCIINGDAWGIRTNGPWGLVYTHPDAFAPLNVATHPTPVYEIIWDLVVLAAIWRYRRWPRPDGALFLTYATLYSLGRFFINFYRENVISFAGLQQAQVIAILVFFVSLFLLSLVYGQWKKEAAPAVAEMVETESDEEEEGEEIVYKEV
ncbi:MAG: prolipoprotein diacylglyceryl transferase [Chloroflexi bacterium]|nr:prolipoprotein diacylglyceryl transferase [Chloroflexota bacterium]